MRTSERFPPRDGTVRRKHRARGPERHGFLTANYTFLNERLALHYGIPGVRGDQFRRVTLADENRWGLLGKGSLLLVTSYREPHGARDSRRLHSGKHHGDSTVAAAAGCGRFPGE